MISWCSTLFIQLPLLLNPVRVSYIDNLKPVATSAHIAMTSQVNELNELNPAPAQSELLLVLRLELPEASLAGRRRRRQRRDKLQRSRQPAAANLEIPSPDLKCDVNHKMIQNVQMSCEIRKCSARQLIENRSFALLPLFFHSRLPQLPFLQDL